MSLLGGNANADMCTMHSYLNKYIYIITVIIIIIIIVIINYLLLLYIYVYIYIYTHHRPNLGNEHVQIIFYGWNSRSQGQNQS